MTAQEKHPSDLTPYLDRDFADARYDEIARHLESCPVCAEEMRAWQTMEDMFRDPALEIEVPAFQWTRIQSQLTSPVPVPWMETILRALFRRPTLRWAAAAGLLVLALTVSSSEYTRYLNRSRLLELTNYSVAEQQRLARAENPFRIDDGSNPFSRIQDYADAGNPFANR